MKTSNKVTKFAKFSASALSTKQKAAITGGVDPAPTHYRTVGAGQVTEVLGK